MYKMENSCDLKDISNYSILYPIICGLSSTILVRLIFKMIAVELSESIIFPGFAVGGMILTMFFSLFVYREKYIFSQWCGFMIGIVALIFLNV